MTSQVFEPKSRQLAFGPTVTVKEELDPQVREPTPDITPLL